MMKKLLSTSLMLLLLFTGFAQSVGNTSMKMKLKQLQGTPTLSFSTPDMKTIRDEDAINDQNHGIYRIGVPTYTQITTENAGAWTTNQNGDRIWQLHVKFPGAEALSFLFDRFHLYDAARMDVFDNSGNRLHRTYTANDVLDHGMQNMSLCFGDEMTIQLTEPQGTQPSDILLDRIMYGYRSTGNTNSPVKINESESCEINVNCTPVGNNWQDEKRGVARILVVDTGGQFWCTGSLVNNTALNCKPYFLTALHCGVSTSAANSNQWRFYFGYEAPTCTNPASAGTLDDYFITGCVRLASSNDNGGDSGSDFLLVQLGSLASEATTITTLKSANFNAYWNGWDANNTATTGGVGIHHPAGDIKKISTFNGTTTTAGWNGNGLQSHWQLSWSANSNGHGVTEGGSSGSPLFSNATGRIVGTLTGGSSYCTALTSPDYYGKMSFHWTSNGAPANEQLKTYLDPGNSGLLVLNGSNDPCAAPNQPPVANFSATPLTVCPGSNVTFTDLSTNTPTSWSWSFPGGTPATSTVQNPVVTYAAPGVYSVTLTATNANGSDAEVKNNYITVLGNGVSLPLVEGFTNATFVPAGWSLVNANASPTTWVRTVLAGNTPTTGNSMMFDNFNYNDSDDDEVRLQAVSLVGQSSPELKFDVAYAPYNATNFDGLQVLVSTDCGATFTSVYNKSNTTLATAPATTNAFTPTAAQWRTETVSLTPYVGQGNVVIAFRNLSGYGNRLFVDNINLSAAATANFTVSPSTVCTGQTVTVTDASSNATSWSWNFGAGATPATATGVGPHNVTYTTAGSKTISLTVNGTSTTTQSVTVVAAPSTPTISAGGPTTFCAGGSVTLTSSSATGNTWSTGATTQSITVSTAGTYTVTVSNGTCSATSAGTTVTVNAAPSTPTISANGPTTFCSGGSVTLTSSSATGNTWSTGATTQSITVSTAGTYTVTVSNGTCTATSAGTAITVNPQPSTPTISAGGPTTFCSGGSVTLTSSSATGNTWSNGATTQSITVSAAGTYTVTVSNGTCSATSAGTIVTVNAAPSTPTISTNGPTTFCSGGSVTLTSSSATGNTWSTGATTQSITVSAAGTYTVTVSNGTCTATSAGTLVTVLAPPATPTISAGGPTTFCEGESVILTSSSAANNTWSNGATTQSITVSAAGTYSVTVGGGSCTATSSGTSITVNAAPSTPTVSANGSTTFCSGGSVTLTSSSATGNTWSNGATTQSITVSTAGTYSVTVSNGTCSATSAGTVVTVNQQPATPTIAANGPTTFCSGDEVTLTSSSANGNTWSNGATTQSITVTVGGTYTVTVANAGCLATSSGTAVTVNPLPSVSFGALADMCDYNAAITLTQGSPAGGSYSGNGVSGGQFDPSAAGLGTSTLVYTYIDGNGCMNTATSNVVVDDCAGVNEQSTVLVTIFPNPSEGVITIHTGNALIKSVKVFDYAGRLVKEINTGNTTVLEADLSSLSQGAYHITVATEHGVSNQVVMFHK